MEISQIYQQILVSCQQISEMLRYSAGDEETGTQNKFGDLQLNSDVQSDEIYALSEEQPVLKQMNGEKYIVTFDPLDGSSIIQSNFSVGSIFGIWNCGSDNLLGQSCKENLIGAAMCLYGSRTTILLTNKDGQVDELTLQKDNQWKITKNNLQIKQKGKVFAPGNLRAANENENYKKLIEYWIQNRYTGGMVPDIYQIFIKQEGIFTNIATDKSPAKLRLLYESAPIAYLVEKAGGFASNGTDPLLDVIVKDYDQRGPICVGSKEEIELVKKTLQQ